MQRSVFCSHLFRSRRPRCAATPAARAVRRTPIRLAAAAFVAACAGGGAVTGTGPTPPPPVLPGANEYQNPVLNADFPDPAVVRGADGAYYAYATQTSGLRVQVSRSTDLVTWGTPFEAMPAKPAWASESQNFWAPDVALRDGRYVMYFSAQIDASKRTAPDQGFCIGMATSTAPTGPFVGEAQPVVCGPEFTTIDPQGFDDPQTGKRYLYWGSGFAPIRVQELAADRASFAAGSSPAAVVPARPGQPYENLVEGAWVTYRAPYYYLFYSGDNCCGVVTNVRYAVMVARSASPTGPFEFRGNPNGGAPVLRAGTRWLGPGHNAVVRDAAGGDWMLYHAIDGNNPYLIAGRTDLSRRVLLLDRITYGADGWPTVGVDGTPTTTPQTRPQP